MVSTGLIGYNVTSVSEDCDRKEQIWVKCRRHEARYALLCAVGFFNLNIHHLFPWLSPSTETSAH